jgi:hypothetical protein
MCGIRFDLLSDPGYKDPKVVRIVLASGAPYLLENLFTPYEVARVAQEDFDHPKLHPVRKISEPSG